MSGTDATSLLASLAKLQHTPKEEWLHACLQLLHWRCRELDGEGMLTVLRSLVGLNVVLMGGPWLDDFTARLYSKLPDLSPQSKADLIACYGTFGWAPPKAWLAAFQMMCLSQIEEGVMNEDQLEQVVVALGSLKVTPSLTLMQHFYDTTQRRLSDIPPDRLVAILTAVKRAGLVPEADWLKAVVDTVRPQLKRFQVVQLDAVVQALIHFESKSENKHKWLSDFVAYLKEFFLY